MKINAVAFFKVSLGLAIGMSYSGLISVAWLFRVDLACKNVLNIGHDDCRHPFRFGIPKRCQFAHSKGARVCDAVSCSLLKNWQ